MDTLDLRSRIEALEANIASLPKGSITKKRINGKEYYYHRITQNKKRTEKYIPFEEVESLRYQIARRKKLETELKMMKSALPVREEVAPYDASHTFSTYVRIGSALEKFVSPVKSLKKRDCYAVLHDYVFGDLQDRVFILYGLRRTGKTTMIRQILCDMTDAQREKSAFLQIKPTDTLADVNRDLQYLEAQGFHYVFLDEVTFLKDFIEGAALFSDIYASSGMKIVLSGTDSLGFFFTKEEQLYDRCILLHTTFISYREFETVLGIQGIEKYIQYGGTMSLSGMQYNANTYAKTTNATDEYVDSAIAKNIQHSLQYYRDGGHFRSLYDLYQNNELTSAINRVVEDMNHRFTKDVLTRTFESHDLSLSARNLLHDRTKPLDLRQHMTEESVTDTLKQLLDILDAEEQSVEIQDTHAYQIQEYLALLDVIMTVDCVHFPNVSQRDQITIISQPGLRYAQATALVESLLQDEAFNTLSLIDRSHILQRILSEIQGRMMEDIVLLETKLANPAKEVFQLQFAVEEFDMVVFDPAALSCKIYEIKFSQEVVPDQYRHLLDEGKCRDAEFHFGSITSKCVIYRGESKQIDGIQYYNVEEYLKLLA